MPVTDEEDVVVYYHGLPQDGLLIGSNARGKRSAFADNWPERARYWLPTVDHPSDKAGIRFHVSVPDGWRVTSARSGSHSFAVDSRGTANISGLRGKCAVHFETKRF